jgi:hypothetical protein
MSEEILETSALLAEYGRIRRELRRQQAECDALRGELGQAEAATVAEREKRRKLEKAALALSDSASRAVGYDHRLVVLVLRSALAELRAVLNSQQ